MQRGSVDVGHRPHCRRRAEGEITERQAAANLVADVLNVEKRLAVCAPVKMPPQVYDALVSFSFNVGTGAACRSTLVSFIKRQQWPRACDQLTRWVYVNGEINKGLENRRARERAYCLRGFNESDVVFTGRAYCGCALAAS